PRQRPLQERCSEIRRGQQPPPWPHRRQARARRSRVQGEEPAPATLPVGVGDARAGARQRRRLRRHLVPALAAEPLSDQGWRGRQAARGRGEPAPLGCPEGLGGEDEPTEDPGSNNYVSPEDLARGEARIEVDPNRTVVAYCT